MVAFQVLYTYPNNFRAYKALIAAEYSENKVRVVSEPPEFVLGNTNKSECFLAKFPLGKVTPTNHQFFTIDRDSILRYQPLKQLMAHQSTRAMPLHTIVST